MNPASSVRGPKYSIKRGKTSVLSAEEARQLLDSIETDTINDTVPSSLSITAIGAGALGSQAIPKLIQSGFGIWKIIDEDHLAKDRADETR